MTRPPTPAGPGQRPDPQRLPAPPPEARALSERLATMIRRDIAEAGGSVSFAAFMERALYTPGLGYYVNGLRKFGAAGDFVTAPEVSSLFGRCLARQCAEVLDAVGGGEILEFGAGSGALAADLLPELERLGQAPARYAILEVSGELRARQRETLAARTPHLLERVTWLDALPDTPLHGVILVNEVLDAMPVHRFRVQPDGVNEWRVCWRDGRFQWQPGAVTDARLERAVHALRSALPAPLPPGYTSELCLMLAPWVRSLARVLGRGTALLIDYGFPAAEYYHPQRTHGTLMCHYRHRAHADPFFLPGLQDITAHVDFTAVARAGAAAGLEVAGYTTQANFLLAGGLDALVAESDPDDVPRHLALAQQVKTLTLPGEMGERFKVMALARGPGAPLSGFALRDLRDRL